MVNLNANAPALQINNNGLLLVTPVGGGLTFLPTWSAGAFAFR
jgi:hypothetical protein